MALAYAREGIELVESDFVDNSACVELVEGKGWGIQACLDDVCIMPKGDDQTFLQKLLQTPQIKNSRHFGSSKQSNNSFVVHHYAGAVQYTITDFCEKNKDALSADITAIVAAATVKRSTLVLCTNATAVAQCAECAAGSYSEAGATQCTECDAGSYAGASGEEGDGGEEGEETGFHGGVEDV